MIKLTPTWKEKGTCMGVKSMTMDRLILLRRMGRQFRKGAESCDSVINRLLDYWQENHREKQNVQTQD